MNQEQRPEPIGNVFCRGCIAIGTGCMRCGRCAIALASRVQELETEAMHAMSEASNLAQSMFDSQYSQEHAYQSGRITWGLCDDLRGVISQISNMSVGLVRDIEPERDHSDEDAAIAAGKVQAAVQRRGG